MNEQDIARRIALKIDAGVAEHGWIVQAVGDSPPFSYTIGESLRGAAEYLLPLLSPPVAHSILNDIVQRVRDRSLHVAEHTVDRHAIRNLPVAYRPLHPDWRDLVTQADAFCARNYRDEAFVWVVVLPDPQGRLPWEAGYDWPAQPRFWEPKPAPVNA